MTIRYRAAHPVGPTVLVVDIVIVTAEPRGAYHLTPLSASLSESSHRFTHLVPYDEPVQGDPCVPVTANVQALERADRLVVTGGTFSPWTAMVAWRAAQLGIPTRFSELAGVPAAPGAGLPPVSAVSALSPDGAVSLASYIGCDVDDIVITGTPALDCLPTWEPVPGRVLLLSTSDMLLRDPDGTLLGLAATLSAEGFEVRVRCHPREDRAPWAGFHIVEGETQAESAASAMVTVGYPGSAHALCAAVGSPVVSLAPTPELADVFSPSLSAMVPAHCVSIAEALAAVHYPVPCIPERVAAVVGPLGDSARRVVEFFTAC